MKETKVMKSFNVKKYNDEINRFNKLTDKVNGIIGVFIGWGAEKEMSKEWFEGLLVHPESRFQTYLNLEAMIQDMQCKYGVLWKDCDKEYFLNNYTGLLGELSRTVKKEMDFLELLPEIREAYGKLFTIEDYHAVKTDDAERLIMEQCIEWEED